MLSQPTNHEHGDVPDEIQRRSTLLLRTLPILLIPAVAGAITVLLLRLVSDVPFPPAGARPPFAPLAPIAIMVIFFSALIVLARLRRPTISALMLIAVWTLLTTVGALQTGVSSYFPALLIIPICAAGLLIDWVACVSLAALALLLVGSIAWLEQRGLLTQTAPPPFIATNQSYLAFGFWAAIFVTVAALTSLLAGGLQRALRQTRAQARALGELSSQLEARVERQTAQILEQEREAATLAERARLAREIHDTLAQGLTGIVVQLGAAQRAMAAEPGAADQHIDLAQRLAREALAEARRSVWNLRAPALERGDLGDALRGLTARFARPETAATFEQRGDPWPLSPDVESALLRVAQEALANAAKHANPTRVSVALEYAPDHVRLSVADDGVGFAEDELLAPAGEPGPWGGFGLLGMRERLSGLGGALELRNGAGAEVVAVVPRN